MRKILTFVLLLFCYSSISQNRIPQDGENIIFYPLNESNSITHEGYDCFYSFEQVASKGYYNFRPKFRFKRNDLKMTPAHEIENYSFYVEKQETILKSGKEYLLLFLTRKEDGERVVLRIPKFFDEKSNSITQSFTKYKISFFSNIKHFSNIVLPYINEDTLYSIKKKYTKKELVYGLRGYNKLGHDIWNKRSGDFEDLSEVINASFCKYEYNKPYQCLELDFLNLSDDLIYKQLCTSVQEPNGGIIKIPITYLVGNTNFYDKRQDGVYCFLSDFFYDKEEYLQNEFKIYKCEDAVKKYTGKDVYYGLDKMYQYENIHSKKFNALENRILKTNELYVLKQGTYKCIGFDILRRADEDYKSSFVPFAILKDSVGVEFRVPATKLNFSMNYGYGASIKNEKFEEYFVLSELVNSIVQKRAEIKRLEELAAKERKLSLEKKYGKTYANFLYDQKDTVVKRFDSLAKKYGKANAKLIIEGHVRLGWTREMCRESWGNPNDINTMTGPWGVHEQWVYEYSFSDSYSMYCLYFENGILTTIQD